MSQAITGGGNGGDVGGGNGGDVGGGLKLQVKGGTVFFDGSEYEVFVNKGGNKFFAVVVDVVAADYYLRNLRKKIFYDNGKAFYLRKVYVNKNGNAFYYDYWLCRNIFVDEEGRTYSLGINGARYDDEFCDDGYDSDGRDINGGYVGYDGDDGDDDKDGLP